MQDQLRNRLRPIHRRLKLVRMSRAAAMGLCVGAAAILLFAILEIAAGGEPMKRHGWLLLPLASALAGAFVGMIRPLDDLQVARSVDRQYRLKDSVATAWQLASLPVKEELVQLQIQDSLQRLEPVVPEGVLRWRMPRSAVFGTIWWLLAAIIFVWPRPMPSVDTRQESVDAIVPEVHRSVAEFVEKNVLEDLQRLAEMTGTPAPEVRSIRQLSDTIKSQTDRLRDSKQTTRETLSQLSEIQSHVSQTRDEIDPAKLDQQFAGIAKALAAAGELQAVSDAMEQKDYQLAADQLKQISPQQQDVDIAEQIREDLEKVEQDLRQKGNDALADAVQSFQDALADPDAQAAQQLTAPLVQMLQQQALRTEIAQQMASQITALGEAKAMSRSGGKNIAKSDQSRETWGQGDAGNPLGGNSSLLDTNRQREQITGIQGEGPTQRNRVQQPTEASEVAQRPTREVFQKYQQMAEDVLRREALPISHRQTIRRYFQSIRPDHSSADHPK